MKLRLLILRLQELERIMGNVDVEMCITPITRIPKSPFNYLLVDQAGMSFGVRDGKSFDCVVIHGKDSLYGKDSQT